MSVVLVTGVAGFVGGHLARELLDRGHEVHGLDLADPDAARLLDPVRDDPRFSYTRADVRDADALRAWYRPEAETVYHLASVVGVRRYMEDPLALIDIVVGGTRTMLELAAGNGARFVLTSTSEVYGKNPDVPWAEDGDRVLGPTSVDRWSYSTAKALCEHMVYGMHRARGVPFSIVRLFNAYGPGQNPIYVVSQSVRRALRGEPPQVYDTGRQTRCFTYIGDVVGGIVAAGERPEALGEAFNLGSDRESTVAEVVRTVCEVAGYDAPTEAFDTATRYGAVYEDIPRRVPAVDKARRLLGWEATTSVADGVKQTVEWARANPWYLADPR